MVAACSIRRGKSEDYLTVKRLVDAAVLEIDDDRLRRQLAGDGGVVHIATVENTAVGVVAVETSVDSDDPALAGFDCEVFADVDTESDIDHEPAYITAIAVRNSRQNRGIGRQLLESVAEEVSPRPLIAEFSADLKPFYRACGFEIESGETRLWGVRWE